jgi:hypothetical protein
VGGTATACQAVVLSDDDQARQAAQTWLIVGAGSALLPMYGLYRTFLGWGRGE